MEGWIRWSAVRRPDRSGPQHLEGVEVGGPGERPVRPGRPAAGGAPDGIRGGARHGHGGRRGGQYAGGHVRERGAAGPLVGGRADGARAVPADGPVYGRHAGRGGRGGRAGQGGDGVRLARPYAQEQRSEQHAEGHRDDGTPRRPTPCAPAPHVLPAPHGRRW
ncbi:hypothetical protein E6W17_13810 [Streptomyces sp. A1547]|nr:hypothetical protein E6W17_13810 [Streptomyces sp. A1547]